MRNEYRTILTPPVDWQAFPIRRPAQLDDSAQPSHRDIKLEGTIEDILVPTDFSPSSDQALRTAMGLAKHCGAAVTLLHVVDVNLHTPSTGPVNAAKLEEKLEREGRERLVETVRNLMGERVELRPVISEGLPFEKICAAARQSDLVVIGKGQSRRFWRLFSRRTVKAVLDKAPCPVLVVRTET